MGIRVRQCTWLAAVGALALVHAASVRAEPRLSKNSNEGLPPIRFVSPGQFAFDQLLKPVALRLSDLASQKLALPARVEVARSSLPLKRITLLGGDRVTAEILRWQTAEVELRLLNGQKLIVPRDAIADVQTPPGEREVCYESFDQRSASVAAIPENVNRPMIDAAWIEAPDSTDSRNGLNIGKALPPLAYEFPQPLPASRVQLWFRVSSLDAQASVSDSAKSGTSLSINFDFATAPAAQLSVQVATKEASVSSTGVADESITRQSVALSNGWHCLTALLLADRSLFVIDESLLWSANRSLGPLGAVRFSGQGAAWINDLQVSRFDAATNERLARPSTQDDCLALTDGEEWFGRISQVTAAHVVLADSSSERIITWPHMAGFGLRQVDKPVTGPLLPIGLSAVIEWQPHLDRPQQLADRITATIVHIDRQFVIVAHPWLGRFAIPWSQIARIEPQFFGQSLTLDARRRHLGDAIRDDFQRQMPDGTEWALKVQIPPQTKLADAQVWLSLEVVDLEPAGLQTPPASPFLRELRAGQLLTKISINNQPAGDLNRWIQYRATPDRPERIRCLLPKGQLRDGENIIRLHQIPLKTAGTRFDNCELSNLRLELVDPFR
ncbi:MAG: hypothetical protein JWP89_339 [Schlesneria sp.]|nr:hypothetical protein [Schlesneria sp.]